MRVRDIWHWRVNRGLESFERWLGHTDEVWVRVVMGQETRRLIQACPYETFDVLEVGGTNWQHFGFKTYTGANFPEYDVCSGPLRLEAFDMVIMEQILEHLLWPYRAVRNLWTMLKPGGCALVTVPFLIKVHAFPVDCSRWTELGLKHLLAEGGFALERITAGSWGNRSCVIRGFDRVSPWIPWWHSLKNDPKFPVMVWALARK